MDIIGLLFMLIVAIVIGAVAETLTKTRMPMGWLGNILVAFIGAYLGQLIFGLIGLGTVGPAVGGFPIIQTIVGAIIAISIFILIRNTMMGGRTRAM